MKLFGYNITKAEKRSIPEESYAPYSNLLPFGFFSDNDSVMCLSAVYRATELISDSVALLPIKVKVINETHKEEMPNHPLNMVFRNGMKLLDKYTFMKLLVQSVILKGNGFAYIERAADGTVTGLRFLESGDVTINYNKLSNKLTYTCTTIRKSTIPPEDMIHLIKNTWDGVNGVSVLTYARRITAIASNTENSAKSFFSNGCNLGGIITVQGQLSEKQKQDIRQNWSQAFNNSGTGGCLLGVLQGNMSYQPIQLNAADSQMIESRQYNVQDIARFFGVSPVLLGDLSHAGYATIEATQQQFLLHTLQSYIVMIEKEFSRKLLKSSEDNLEINLDETVLLRTDKTAQAAYYTTMLQNGVMCINEVRRDLGMSEIEGGDKHLIAYTDIAQNQINNGPSENE